MNPTNITDHNGAEIMDDDILHIMEPNGVTYESEVYYHDGLWCAEINDGEQWHMVPIEFAMMHDWRFYVIYEGDLI